MALRRAVAMAAGIPSSRRIVPARLLSTSTTLPPDSTTGQREEQQQEIPITSNSSGGGGSQGWSDDAFKGKRRAELRQFDGVIRATQVAEALRIGFQEGRVIGCSSSSPSTATASSSSPFSGGPDVEAVIRATRARPSLLAPLAGGVGVGLRCLAQVLPSGAGGGGSANPLARGVLGAVEETLDDCLRSLIHQQQQQQQQTMATATKGTQEGEGESPAAAIKAFVKARRDGLPDPGVGVEGAGPGAEGGGSPLAQGAQLLCRTLLKGAERL